MKGMDDMSYKGQIWILLSVAFLLVSCSNGVDVDNLSEGQADGADVDDIPSQQTEGMSEANNRLGFSTFRLLNQASEGNIFISPTSLYTALLLAYNGAEGETKTAFSTMLQVAEWTDEEVNEAMSALLDSFDKDTDDIEISSGNSLWLVDDYNFKEGYEKAMVKYYNARIETIDQTDEASANKINTWVGDETNDKIDEIIASPLSENFVALLVNVLYFNGKWQYEFDEANTEEAVFYTPDSDVDVPFMSFEEDLAYLETDEMQAIQLPYGKGEMAMHVYVPKEGRDMADFVQRTLPDEWDSWQSEFKGETVALSLPKFTLEYELVLNDILQELGIEQAFSNAADFSNMVEETSALIISEVKQKTYVDVNEAGTEAAVATSVLMEESALIWSEPLEMNVNRPFVFAITDTETDAILFLGKINNPTDE